MAVEEGTLPVGPTDKLLDTAIVEHADGTPVHREGVFIGDAGNAAARAEVKRSSPFLSDASNNEQTYAQAISDQRLEFLQDTLTGILTELKIITLHLQLGSDEEIREGDVA